MTNRWLEIYVTVEDGELAEAIAEVMARYLPDGVSIRATGVVFDPDSEGRGIGPYRVAGYIPEGETEDVVRGQIEAGLGHLSLIRPIPEPGFKRVDEENWNESWKEHYHPVRIGRRLIVLPEWDREVPDGLLPVWIDPGMAFGTGTHPTTQLAMEMLEERLGQAPGTDVLDIGCGSGILSLAAARLGAGTIVGVDVDEDSIENARLNARINGLEERVRLDVGSVGDLLAGAYPSRTAGLVVANILTHILVRLMAEGLGELVAPGGTLILSGILAEREAEMLDAVLPRGFRLQHRKQVGDWVALAFGHAADGARLPASGVTPHPAP